MNVLGRTLLAVALFAFSAGIAVFVAPHSVYAQTTAATDMRPTTDEDATPAAKSKKKTAAKSSAGTERVASRGGKSEQSIIALVNDEPITGYEVRMRSEMLSGGAAAEYMKKNAEGRWKAMMSSKNIQQEFQEYAKKRQPRTKEELQVIQKDFIMSKRNAMMNQLQSEARSQAMAKSSKEALDELIDEKLKMQEAKRVGATASEEEINTVIKSIADRNKLSLDQLTKSLGGSLEPMKQRIRTTLAWNEVVRRKFGPQISVATRDVDKYIAAVPGAGEDEVEMQVRRIRINVAAKSDQAAVTQAIAQAETLRAKFTNCKNLGQLAAGVPGVRVEDLGKRRPSTFPEPTRSLLSSAKENDMLPATVAEGGVDLFAVCERTVVKADDQKRTQAEGELKQREFELLSKKHLKDLRQDASIEYR